ncbi:MAG: hypothetical protein GF355_06060 [Candidatus Eisenbacteria bacterium]|nr:hypothetical protein [Candidatus Eisenbacteria bacterium]
MRRTPVAESAEDRILEAAEASQRFRAGAFYLVLRALERAQHARGRVDHVTGRDLLESLRDIARREYGPMALTVLEHVGLRSTLDVGELVFLMIDWKLLRKRDEDSLDEFRDVYDFEEAFTYEW